MCIKIESRKRWELQFSEKSVKLQLLIRFRMATKLKDFWQVSFKEETYFSDAYSIVCPLINFTFTFSSGWTIRNTKLVGCNNHNAIFNSWVCCYYCEITAISTNTLLEGLPLRDNDTSCAFHWHINKTEQGVYIPKCASDMKISFAGEQKIHHYWKTIVYSRIVFNKCQLQFWCLFVFKLNRNCHVYTFYITKNKYIIWTYIIIYFYKYIQYNLL